MSNPTNVVPNNPSASEIKRPIVQLVLPEGQSVGVRLIDFLPDSVRLSSPSGLSVGRGLNVQVFLTSSNRRFAEVQYAGWVGKEYHLGVKWKCAQHRDAARRARLADDPDLPEKTKRFYTCLPAQFYTFWQLIETGRLHVLEDVIDQFQRSAKYAREDLVNKCQELKDAINHKATHEFIAILLDELCKECVQPTAPAQPAAPPSTPVMVHDTLSSSHKTHAGNGRADAFLGTSSWVLGTVLVLVGHLLTIL